MNFCPGHNLQSKEASNFKLHTQIDHIKGGPSDLGRKILQKY